ncbi:hypothetical protein MHB43_06625 [Paenibacillus sp. FSL H8-0317]|uniref:hypothetical protein n=1 Tax=unclassified Paenibacillus TaxID=185978 RepID=UPI0030CA7036
MPLINGYSLENSSIDGSAFEKLQRISLPTRNPVSYDVPNGSSEREMASFFTIRGAKILRIGPSAAATYTLLGLSVPSQSGITAYYALTDRFGNRWPITTVVTYYLWLRPIFVDLEQGTVWTSVSGGSPITPMETSGATVGWNKADLANKPAGFDVNGPVYFSLIATNTTGATQRIQIYFLNLEAVAK